MALSSLSSSILSFNTKLLKLVPTFGVYPSIILALRDSIYVFLFYNEAFAIVTTGRDSDIYNKSFVGLRSFIPSVSIDVSLPNYSISSANKEKCLTSITSFMVAFISFIIFAYAAILPNHL